MSTTQGIEQQITNAAESTAEGLDQAGTQASNAIHNAVLAGGEPTRKIADFLHGTWLGHPVHPMLTDIVVGAWVIGAGFDAAAAITGSREYARTGDRLAAIGTVAAVPTAITGMADFSTFPEWSAKTVTLHGMLNIANFGLYCASLVERRRGNRRRGVAYSAVAVGLSLVSAWLGGKLVYRQRVGVNNADRFEGPQQWKSVLPASELPDRKPVRVEHEGKGVLVWREGQTVFAIGSVCSHAGGPLEKGTVQGHCVECPWHNSVFDLHTGKVVHGPATNPQPQFHARITNGQVEIRLASPSV